MALQHAQRISYGALQRRFALEDVKEELIYAKHLRLRAVPHAIAVGRQVHTLW